MVAILSSYLGAIKRVHYTHVKTAAFPKGPYGQNLTNISFTGSSCDSVASAKGKYFFLSIIHLLTYVTIHAEVVTVAVFSTLLVLLVIGLPTLNVAIVILVKRYRRRRTLLDQTKSEQTTEGKNVDERYVQLDPLSESKTNDSATETGSRSQSDVNTERPTNTSKPESFGQNKLFDEYNKKEEGKQEPDEATSTSSARIDTLPSTEEDQDIHTEPPPQATDEDEEDDVFDPSATSDHHETLLPHDRPRRPSSASRQSMEESAAQPRRPRSASRSSGKSHRLSFTRVSASSDHMEAESLIPEDAVEEAKNE